MSEFTIAELRESAVVGFATDRSPAWHHSGTPVQQLVDAGICYPGPVPIERVREFCGWEASTVDVSQVITTGMDMLSLPDGVNLRAVVQTLPDGSLRLLAVNGGAYQTTGPAETVMPMVEELVDLGCEVATAMNLRGRYIASSLRVPEGAEVELAGLGKARLVINATDSTDGTLPTTWHTSAVIIVCDNTAKMSLAGAVDSYRLRHTKNRQFSRADAMEAIELTLKNGQNWADHFNAMAEVKFTDPDLARFLDSALPIVDDMTARSRTSTDRKRTEITRLWRSDSRVTPVTGTLAGAYQTVSTFDQWSSTARGSKNALSRFQKGIRPTSGATPMTDNLTTWLKARDRDLVLA